MTAADLELANQMARREEVILEIHNPPVPVVAVTPVVNVSSVPEQPPPPYHVAILLPPKQSDADELPPPTYDKAIIR